MQKNLETILKHTKQNGECLEWTRCFNTDGYPRAVIDGNNNAKVHRVVWELYNQSSAKGFVVRHKCDNIKCINPKHLELGSHTDNIQDRTTRERHGAAKLKHEDVQAIRYLYAKGGWTQKRLAQLFNVHRNTVNSLLNFKHWKHLTV